MNYFLRPISLSLYYFIFIAVSLVQAQDSEFSNKKKDNDYAILFRFDNDLISGSDDFYTNGLYLGFVNLSNSFEESIFPDFLGRGLSHLPGLNPDGRLVSSGFSFAHRMFTPHDIENPDPILDDMPYSGQLMFSLSAGTQNNRHLDAWTISIGETGPVTRAAEIQFDVHYSLLAPEAEGWQYQLKNEILVNLLYEHRFRLFEKSNKVRFFDAMLNGSGGLGNLSSFAEISFGLRLGWNIPNDFYAPTSLYVNPLIGVLPTNENQKKFSFYIFGNISGSYTFNNIALDGNTFDENSPFIEYEHLNSRISYGFVLGSNKFHLIYNLVYEPITWENSFQIKEDMYGQLSFVWIF